MSRTCVEGFAGPINASAIHPLVNNPNAPNTMPAINAISKEALRTPFALVLSFAPTARPSIANIPMPKEPKMEKAVHEIGPMTCIEANVSELYRPKMSRSVNMIIVPNKPDIKMGQARRRISSRSVWSVDVVTLVSPIDALILFYVMIHRECCIVRGNPILRSP